MTTFVKSTCPSETEIALMPLNKMVDRGIRLQRICKRAAEELDKIKARFRSEATIIKTTTSPKVNPIPFTGNIGSCDVTFKGDSLKCRENAKPIELKDKMPAEVFHNLFDVETVAKPCKDFKKKFENLTPANKALIMEYFQHVPNAPAVEFSE